MESDNTAIQQPFVKKRVACHAAGLHKLYGNPSKKPMLDLATTAAAAAVEGEGGAGENFKEGNNEKISMVGRKEIRPPVPAPPASSSTTASTVQKSKNISLLAQKPVIEKDMVFETASLKYAARKRLTLGWNRLDNEFDLAYFQMQYQFPRDQVVYIGKDLDQSLLGDDKCKHFAFKKLVEGKEEWIFKKLCCVKDCRRLCLTGTKCETHRKGITPV
jgi:hypothetical protein